MLSRYRVVAQKLLELAGKTNRKVIAVFGPNPAACHAAVSYLREQVPEIPIWLFTTSQPLPETRALCEQVQVLGGPLALLLDAEVRLWPRWVALSAGAWTGERGGWPLKLAPFLIPPFRAVFLNDQGGFLSGAAPILRHIRRRFFEAAFSAWHRTQDLARAYWLLVSYHIWRSGPCRRVRDVARAVSLLAVASILKWGGYPHRHWFQRLHGQGLLTIAVTRRRGGEFARFFHEGSNWRGGELETAARQTGARWIVWQDHDTAEEIQDLLPLFDDPRTFAVSRQDHYRGWKSALMPMAPFRILQPDEASQVLAPISSAIVIDAEKLLALGVPRGHLVISAWLLLFWKAAAAGWRSYSVGRPQEIGPQPDHPVQEAAFFLEVLSDWGLRLLGPAEGDLSRGTISSCRAVASRRGPSDRLRVLIVSPFVPYPLSHGGAVRMYNLCAAMRDRVHFVLAAIREREDVVDYGKLCEVFEEVHVVDLDEPRLSDRRLPVQVRHHRSSSLRALIRDQVTAHNPHVMQIEYTHMAPFRDAAPELPALLVEHDLTFSLYEQLAQHERSRRTRCDYERWLAFEREQFRAFNGVWTVSEDDRRRAIEEGSARERTFTIPNGVDVERFQPAHELADVPEVLYVGSFRHLPNIIGFETLYREIMPRVWEHVPQTRLRVVAGPQPELFWQKLRGTPSPRDIDSRITIHGFVEDLRPVYAAAWAVAVPLDVSAGTNIKVLEAMACGKAMVSTPVGCAGLELRHDHEALICADRATFVRGLCAILSDGNLRSRLESQARSTAEKRFTWAAIAEAAYESYTALANVPAPGRSSRALAAR